MSKIEFKLNKQGVRHLLYCQKMKDALSSLAESLRPNDEYEIKNMPTRTIVSIKSDQTWDDNVRNNTLIKKLYGAKK